MDKVEFLITTSTNQIDENPQLAGDLVEQKIQYKDVRVENLSSINSYKPEWEILEDLNKDN